MTPEPDPPPPRELRCPHCGQASLSLIDVWRRFYYCHVCRRTWPKVEQDVNGVEIAGE